MGQRLRSHRTHLKAKEPADHVNRVQLHPKGGGEWDRVRTGWACVSGVAYGDERVETSAAYRVKTGATL